VVGGLLPWTFILGNAIFGFLAEALSSIEQYEHVVLGPLMGILWNGAFTGFVAEVTMVIPYIPALLHPLGCD
jgi:ferrous iron transport protein B